MRDYGVAGQAGLEGTPQEWVDKMVKLCDLIKPKLKKTGVMYWNIGETYFGNSSYSEEGRQGYEEKTGMMMNAKKAVRTGQPDPKLNERLRAREQARCEKRPWLQPKQLLGLPWRFAIAMQNKGWILRSTIIWHKPNAMPSSVKDRFSTDFEYVFMFVKSNRYFFDLDAVRVPHEGLPAMFNLRVRDAQLGRPEARLGVKASETEIKSYDEQKMTKQAQHPNRQVNGFNERWKNLQEKGQQVQSMHVARKEFAESMAGGGSGVKGHKGYYDADGNLLINPAGKNPGCVWEITTQPHPFAHFACFPEELAEKCIKSGCPRGGAVLDPFMGSGTVAVVAKNLGRKYIGFELNPKYIEIAENRLKGVTNWQIIKDIENGIQQVIKT